MGIISPKKDTAASKVLITCLVIILAPILIAVMLSYLLWGAILHIAMWVTWRKQSVLFIYSDSPTWKEYIEREILPHIQDRAVILNWSDRRNWKNSLAVLTFRYFGGDRNFNPIAIVFRPFRLVKIYRFFQAFQEFKHGDAKKVEEIKEKFFEVLGI